MNRRSPLSWVPTWMRLCVQRVGLLLVDWLIQSLTDLSAKASFLDTWCLWRGRFRSSRTNSSVLNNLHPDVSVPELLLGLSLWALKALHFKEIHYHMQTPVGGECNKFWEYLLRYPKTQCEEQRHLGSAFVKGGPLKRQAYLCNQFC